MQTTSSSTFTTSTSTTSSEVVSKVSSISFNNSGQDLKLDAITDGSFESVLNSLKAKTGHDNVKLMYEQGGFEVEIRSAHDWMTKIGAKKVGKISVLKADADYQVDTFMKYDANRVVIDLKGCDADVQQLKVQIAAPYEKMNKEQADIILKLNNDNAAINAKVVTAEFEANQAKNKLVKEAELRVKREHTACQMVGNLASMLTKKGVQIEAQYSSLNQWDLFEGYHGAMVSCAEKLIDENKASHNTYIETTNVTINNHITTINAHEARIRDLERQLQEKETYWKNYVENMKADYAAQIAVIDGKITVITIERTSLINERNQLLLDVQHWKDLYNEEVRHHQVAVFEWEKKVDVVRKELQITIQHHKEEVNILNVKYDNVVHNHTIIIDGLNNTHAQNVSQLQSIITKHDTTITNINQQILIISGETKVNQDQLQVTINELNVTVNEKTQIIANLQGEIKNYQSQIKFHEENIVGLNHTIEVTRTEIITIRQQHTITIQKITDSHNEAIQAKIDEFEGRVTKLVEDHRLIIVTWTERGAAYEKQVNELTNQYNQTVAAHQITVNNHVTTINTLTVNITTFEGQIAGYKVDINNARSENSKLSVRFEQLKKSTGEEIARLEGDLKTARETIKTHVKTIETHTTTIETHVTTIETLRKQIIEIQAKIDGDSKKMQMYEANKYTLDIYLDLNVGDETTQPFIQAMKCCYNHGWKELADNKDCWNLAGQEALGTVDGRKALPATFLKLAERKAFFEKNKK